MAVVRPARDAGAAHRPDARLLARPRSQPPLRRLRRLHAHRGLIELGLAAADAHRQERRWQTALSGAAGVVFGLFTLLGPGFGHGLPPADRIYMIAARVAIGSVSGILADRSVPLDRLSGQLFLAGGVGGLCMAVLLVVLRFVMHTATIMWLIGLFTLLPGILLWSIALRLRGLGRASLAATPA